MSDELKLNNLLDALEREWRIAEELGDPTPEYLKAYELIRLEMAFQNSPEVAVNLATLASHWVRTRNPFYIDTAVVNCFAAGVQPSPSLQRLIAQVAYLRLNGKISAGTPKKVTIETAKKTIFVFIANLIHSGVTKSGSCSKAAVKYAQDYRHLDPMKASTLEKYYDAEWRSRGPRGLTLEEETFSRWDKYKDKAAREEWARIAKEAPEADDDLRGERR